MGRLFDVMVFFAKQNYPLEIYFQRFTRVKDGVPVGQEATEGHFSPERHR